MMKAASMGEVVGVEGWGGGSNVRWFGVTAISFAVVSMPRDRIRSLPT